MQWEVIDNVVLKTSFGADLMYHKANRYVPSTIYESNGQARAEIGVNKTINWLNENTVTWTPELGDNHAVNVLGGFTMQRNMTEHVLGSSSSFVNDVMQWNNLGAGAIYNAPASNAPQWSLLSYLARVNYTLKGRYLFSANARVDGSSRFGANNKYGFFPSGAASWRVSDEPFMESVRHIIPNLKIRASYGVTGNTEIGAYGSQATLGSNTWVLGNQQVTGFFPNKIPNPDLKWEKTAQWDVGLDVGLFDNRLRLTADYYRKKTTDLLYDVAIVGVSGYQTMLKNIGSLENKGFEFAIDSDNLTGAFRWTTNFNISFNRNKVLELGGETYKDMGNSGFLKFDSIRRLIVGKPIGIFYGYFFDGIFQNEQEVAQQTASTSPLGVGYRRYKDLDGDGIVDPTNDRDVLGDSNPDFFGGMVNTFSYKGFELNVFLQYNYGNEIFNVNKAELTTPTGGNNVFRSLLDRWTPTNPSNIYPKASTNRAVLVSDFFIEDGSYLKLKTLSLSYGFPMIKSKHIRGIRVYVTGQNLLTWTNYSGFDPEVSYRGATTLEAGEDFGGYPQSRTIMFGVRFDIK
jgi:TonB-linked SusC/RagA family outer membrane protein